MNRNELLTGDQNILSRTKYFCPRQNFFCLRQNFFVHAEGRGNGFLQTAHAISFLLVLNFTALIALKQ